MALKHGFYSNDPEINPDGRLLGYSEPSLSDRVNAERYLFGDACADPVRAHNLVKVMHEGGQKAFPHLWDRIKSYVASPEFVTMEKLSALPDAAPAVEKTEVDRLYESATEDKIREEAAAWATACFCEGEDGYCDPDHASWRYDASFDLSILGDADEWRKWFAQEQQWAAEDGRNYDDMLDRAITDPIVVLVRDGKGYVWDGNHRVGAALVRNMTCLRAIVGTPLPDVQPLYHATPKDNLAAIAENGLRAGSYLAADDGLSAYYQETIEDEGQTPVLLQVSLSSLDQSLLAPDLPGIEEPITTVLGKSEDEIAEEWEVSDGSWRDSLEVVSSVRYNGVIAPDRIRVVCGDDTMQLSEYMAQQSVRRPLSPGM